jgi:40S ribosome biogenesis protein Tsr1 and BMS1 C-terminal
VIVAYELTHVHMLTQVHYVTATIVAALMCYISQFERFLQPGRFCGASVYGPATFQPAPVFLFKETIDDVTGAVTATTLVASGTLLSVNPDHIILKKIVLTGYPIRYTYNITCYT